jgi:hypothetical protein
MQHHLDKSRDEARNLAVLGYLADMMRLQSLCTIQVLQL